MKIHVFGQGQDLVWIPGWGMPSAVFMPVIQTLAGKFTFHLVDLTEEGDTTTNVSQWQCSRLAQIIIDRVPPAIWFGWSLGSLISLQAALISRRVQALVLFAATPCFVRSAQWVHGVERRLLIEFSRELRANTTRTRQRFNALCVHGSITAQQERRYLNQISGQSQISVDLLDAGLYLLMQTDLSADISKIMVPSLWIAGQHDRLIAPSGVYAAAAQMKNSQRIMLSDAAHCPFLSHPLNVAAHISDFLSHI